MRQDIRQELRKYQMDKIKPNFTELGRQLGCDPRTAKKYYYLKEDGYENKRKRRKSKLDPYRNIIDEKVKNSCSATSIFYFIKEMGYTGGISILRDYCHQIKVKKHTTPVVRIQTAPGQSAQVDWKEDFVLHTRKGTPIKFSIFLYVLGYSRKKYLNFVFDRKQDTLFSSLVGAFEFMNGVPKEIVFDNMKTAVDHARSSFTKVVWNEKLLEFARTAGFTPKSCKPFRPQTKGKVESLARTIERLRVYDYEFDNVNDLAQLIHKLNVQLNNELSQATGEKPNTLWTKEKEYLLPFDKNLLLSIIDRDQTRKVSNESMITYKGNKYSVPVKYIGKEVTVNITDSLLLVSFDGRLLRKHSLSNQKINYHHDDLQEILANGVYHDLAEEELERQVQRNITMFDNLRG